MCCYTHCWRSYHYSFFSFVDARCFGRLHHIELRLHALSLYLGMPWWFIIFLAFFFPLEVFPARASSFLAFPGYPAQAPLACQSHVGLEDAWLVSAVGLDQKALQWRSLFSSLRLHQPARWEVLRYTVYWYSDGQHCIEFPVLLLHDSYWQFHQYISEHIGLRSHFAQGYPFVSRFNNALATFGHWLLLEIFESDRCWHPSVRFDRHWYWHRVDWAND